MGYFFTIFDALTGLPLNGCWSMSCNFGDFKQYIGVKKHIHRRNTNDIRKRCYTALDMMECDGYVLGTPRADIGQNWYWGAWDGATDKDIGGVFMFHIMSLIECCARNPDAFMFADIQDENDGAYDDYNNRFHIVFTMNADGSYTNTNRDAIRIARAAHIVSNT